MRKIEKPYFVKNKKLVKTMTFATALIIASLLLFSSIGADSLQNTVSNPAKLKKYVNNGVSNTKVCQDLSTDYNYRAPNVPTNPKPAPMGVPILTEGFEGSWLPTGWTQIITDTGTGSGSILPTWDQTDYDYHSGSYAAGVWWDYVHQDEWLISPEVTLTGSTTGNYYVTFWTYGWEGSIYDDHYYVKISTDSGATWTPVFDLSDLTGNAWNDWAYAYTIDLDAYAEQDIMLAWHAIDCNDPGNPNYPGLWYIWIIDDIEVGYFDVPDNDVGVTSIDAPVSGTASGSITPKATVENFGGSDQTNVPVDMTITRYGTPSTLVSDGFESYIPGSYDFPPGWTISTTNPTGTWFMYSSSQTYSASTYPRVQEAGSDGNAQDESLISPTIDCSALASVNLQFTKYFYAYAPDYATFTVYGSIDGGATWPHTVVTYSATSTIAENIDITTWAAGQANVKFRFRFESPADATLSSYMYFDNFWVGTYALFGPMGDNPPVGWTIENSPANPTTWNTNYWHRYTTLYTSYDSMYYPARIYYLSPYEDVDCSLITPSIDCSALSHVELYMNGYFYYYAGYTHGAIEISISGGAWQLVWDFTATRYHYEYPGYNNYDITSWAAGQSDVKIRFRYYHTAAENGRYWYLGNVRVGDGSGNFIFYDSFQGPQAYSTNFKFWNPDSWVTWNWNRVTGTSTGNQFMNVLTGTSPTCTPAEGSRMAEYNSYSATSGDQARLYTIPCDVSAASTLKMSFQMFHDSVSYQTTADQIEVQASTDGGATWTTVGGPFYRSCTLQGLPLADAWATHYVDLTGYEDETALQIGFLTTSQFGYNMFIDDMVLFDPGFVEEYSETVYVNVDAGETVQAVFPAWTPDAWQFQQDMDILYDAYAATDLSTDTVPENDASVSTFNIHYPFFHDIELLSIDSPITNGPGQTQNVKATIKNIGQYPERNFFVPVQIGSITYTTTVYSSEDFEATNGGYTVGGISEWEWGVPTLSTGPSSAHSGTKLWGTDLEANYIAGLTTLTTPAFTVPTGGVLTFWHWYDTEASYDGGNVKISVNGGAYELLTPDGGYTGTANSANPLYPQPIWTGHVQKFWEEEFFDISAYSGDSVQIRFDFGADPSVMYPGWYIDDVRVISITTTVTPEYDESIGVAAWLNPGQTRQLIYPDWTPANLAIGDSGDIEYGVQAEALISDGQTSNNVAFESIVLSYWHDVLVKTVTQPSIGRDVTWLHYDTEVNVNSLGLTAGGTWEGAIRFTPTELAAYNGFDITKAKFHHGMAGGTSQPSHNGNVKIYDAGTASTPGALLYTQPFTCPAGNAWFTIDLTTGVTIDASKDIWVSIEVTHAAGEYPLGMDASTATVGKGDFIYYSSAWNELYLLGFNNNWNIQAGVEEGGPGPGGIDIYIAPGTESVQSVVKNAGTFTQNGLTCYADIYEYITDPEGNLVYEDEVTGINLNPLGEEKTLNFASYNFNLEGIYNVVMELPLVGDDTPNNNMKILGIGVDDTPPESTHTVNPAVPDGENDWYVSNVQVTLDASDPEVNGVSSGVDVIKYKIDGGAEQIYSATFTVSSDGLHTITYWAVDNVGNAETQNTATFKIDKTDPEIDLTYEVTGGSNIQGWEITFTATCADATSGMDRVEFYLNSNIQETVSGPGPTYQWVIIYHPLPNVDFEAIAYDMAGNYATDLIHNPEPNPHVQGQPSQVPGYNSNTIKIKI